MKTNKHAVFYDIRQVLQREPGLRAIRGKMNFSAADDNQTARLRFNEAMQSQQDLVLTTGCGLPSSLDNLPLRLPSLIVPGLEMLKAYKQTFNAERNVQYQVYQAGAFIKRVNGVTGDETNQTAQFMQRYLQAFTNEFYPELAPVVSFDFNKDVRQDNLEPIREFLQQTDNPQALAYRERINFYATRGPRRGCADTYTAANIYFNCMSDQDIKEPTIIMPVGGQKERPFFFLSALYHSEKRKNTDVSVLPVSFDHQETSPCFSSSQGDLTIGDVFKGNKKAFKPDIHAARKDYETMLEPIGATIPVLMDMARHIRHIL